MVDSKEFHFIPEMGCVDLMDDDELRDDPLTGGQQSSTTNSSTKMLTARNMQEEK